MNNSSFCIYGSCKILSANRDYFQKNVNKLIFAMVKCGVFFAVRTEFLYYLDEFRLQRVKGTISNECYSIEWELWKMDHC
jgi:hypothetical protein